MMDADRRDTNFDNFAIVILAAGSSKRMGARNKLLEPVMGKPLLAHALEAARSLRPADLIVVTGHERALIANAVGDYPVRVVHNVSYSDGMGTSLACGAGAVGANVIGAFIHLGDVPFVSAETFRNLAGALLNDRAGRYQVFVPIHEGRRGHPVLFRRELLHALCELSGDEGARRVIGANSCLEVAVPDTGINRDIDTEADLAAFTRQCGGSCQLSD